MITQVTYSDPGSSTGISFANYGDDARIFEHDRILVVCDAAASYHDRYPVSGLVRVTQRRHGSFPGEEDEAPLREKLSQLRERLNDRARGMRTLAYAYPSGSTRRELKDEARVFAECADLIGGLLPGDDR